MNATDSKLNAAGAPSPALRINRQNTSALNVTVFKGQVISASARNHGMSYRAFGTARGWQVVRYRHDGSVLGTPMGEPLNFASLQEMAGGVAVFAALPVLIKMGCYQRSSV